jgi:cation:H+ antiporter
MLSLLIAIISLIILIKSSDIFIDQSTILAKKIKVRSFLIGFTLIALGTSLPDLVISTYSNIKGAPEVAISTFLGSPIVKTSLILGILALFSNYKLSKTDIKRNIPINLIIYSIFFLLLFAFQFQMTWILGILSIGLLILAIFFAKENNHLVTIKSKTKFNILFLLLSFVVVVTSGKFCVDHVLIFANTFGIEQTIIGYFILAIGTSIPELVTSLTSIRKGNIQLSLGNILGSSLFDILFVSGVASFFVTLNFRPFLTEYFFLIFATGILLLFAILGKKYFISKKEGLGLILVYILFIIIQGI